MYKEREKKRNESPIHRPSILGQELLTSCLESVIRPQVLDRHRRPRQRVNTRFLDVLVDPDPVEAAP